MYGPGTLQAFSSSQLMCYLAEGMHKNEHLAAFGVQLGGLAWEMSWQLQIGRQTDGVTQMGSEGKFHCFSGG